MPLRFKVIFSLIVLIIMTAISVINLLCVTPSSAISNRETPINNGETAIEASSNDIRAVWIFYNELQTSSPDEKQYKQKIDSMFKTIHDKNYNTAFVQVRAFCDAFYDSSYFPTTKYLAAGSPAFDALKIICKAAKTYGIDVHAWINPYRVCYKVQEDLSYLSKVDMLETPSGTYLNPADTEAQLLVLKGIKEIIDNYSVKGIHIDDYFYPADIGNFDDSSYDEYKASGGILERDDWRRSCVNTLVRSAYTLIKEKDKNLIFSISPGADAKKDYETYYADVYTWCGNSGYCDWIVPQIYFGFDNETMPFTDTLNSWVSLVSANNSSASISADSPTQKVKLIIGLPAYKQGVEDKYAGAGAREFIDNTDVIERQIKEVLSLPSCSGYSLYSYSHICS